jgi:deoxyuridine 5'-triphosphate nucleotidohydrolase
MIKVKVEDDGRLPERKTPGSAAWDLYAAEDKFIPAGGYNIVSIGIRSEFDDAIVAVIRDRSSMAAKQLFVTGGIIDADYRGIWKVVINNLNPNDGFTIHKGDRIAQVLFLLLAPTQVVPVSEVGMDNTKRKEGGFGSTGN